MSTYSSSIAQHMLGFDAFSQWLGLSIVNISPKSCTVTMTVREEMTNGFGIAHGGISYSLADSALAFAINAMGRISYSLETSISHVAKVEKDDTLTATVICDSMTHRVGIFRVVVRNQDNTTVALFKGTMYRTEKEWDLDTLES